MGNYFEVITFPDTHSYHTGRAAIDPHRYLPASVGAAATHSGDKVRSQALDSDSAISGERLAAAEVPPGS